MAEEHQFDEKTDYRRSLSWYQIWNLATTQPSVETYRLLAKEANASILQAFLWLLVSYLVGIALLLFFAYLFAGSSRQLFYQGLGMRLASPSWLFMAICLPFVAMMSSVSVMILVGLTHLGAKVLGGKGTYTELLYVYAAIYAPLTLISVVLVFVPIVNMCLTVPFAIYSIVILIIAVKAVSDFGWGRAIVAYFAPLLLLMLVAVGAATVVSVLLGALSGSAM